jgi:hypothetical protein
METTARGNGIEDASEKEESRSYDSEVIRTPVSEEKKRKTGRKRKMVGRRARTGVTFRVQKSTRNANSLTKRTGKVVKQQRVTITDKRGMGMTKREAGDVRW